MHFNKCIKPFNYKVLSQPFIILHDIFDGPATVAPSHMGYNAFVLNQRANIISKGVFQNPFLMSSVSSRLRRSSSPRYPCAGPQPGCGSWCSGDPLRALSSRIPGGRTGSLPDLGRLGGELMGIK